MAESIFLVRHGRSAHMHTGLLNRAQLVAWREAYEAAGIDDRHAPPDELKAIAASCGVVVASPAARAVHSAELLTDGRRIVTSPLLYELELAPPNVGLLRLPLLAWALLIGIRLPVSTAEQERAIDAADWLGELAKQHQTVLVLTHASFRSILGKELLRRGWATGGGRKRSHHWSVWPYRR